MKSAATSGRTTGTFPEGVNGLSVRWIYGSGWRARLVQAGATDAPPLVMLPGWGCTAYTFRHNIRAFAAEGFRVCVVEPPGQGWSDKPDGSSAYTLPKLAQHVLEVFDRLSIRSAPIIGQSLGGGIAIQIALDAPERVQRLALWSPIGFGCTPVVHLGAKLPTALAPILERTVGPAIVRYALHIVYGRSRRPTQEDVREYSAPISSPGFVRAQIELLRNVRWTPISPEERARLTLPTAILTGTEDRLVPYQCLADAAETLPNCRLFVVEGGGHASNETHPDEVNRETLGFLRVPGTMPAS